MRSSTVFLYRQGRVSLKPSLAGPRERMRMGIANPFSTVLMKTIATYFVPVVGLIWMSVHFGCQDPTLVTTGPPSSPGPVNGMLYYLPIGKITIKGEYSSDGSGPNQKSPNGGKPHVGEISPAPSATAAEKATATPTPRGLTITVTSEVEAEAHDDGGVYYARPQSNPIFEDEVHVTVNAKHLLSTGNVTTEDKTAEIVGALASLARTAAGRFTGTEGIENPQPFNFTFHPSNSGEVTTVAGYLQNYYQIKLTVKMNGKEISQCRPVLSNERVKILAAQFGQKGLLFRPAASYTLQLEASTAGQPVLDNTQQFLLPDLTKLYSVEYPRMPFVKKVKNIGFRDGMLSDYNQKVPSPILGFLGIPKAVVDALVPIPGAPPSSGSGSASGTTPLKN